MLVEVILFALTIYILWQAFKKPSDYPPGPWGFPLIGYISMKKDDFSLFKDLKVKYGDVVSFTLGTKTLVMIFDYKLIKEAFVGSNMVDRPDLKAFSLMNGEEKRGLVATNGEHWHRMRRFSLRHLLNLGMGKARLVEAVQNEATALVNDLKKQAGKPASLPHSITIAVLNVVWQLAASKRYSLDDKEILGFDALIVELQNSSVRLVIPDFFPWIKYVIPKYFLRKISREDLKDELATKFEKFVKKSIDDHIKNLHEDDPKDFIDAYLIEMKKLENDPSSQMSIDDLTACISDLFSAGTETTAKTLQWCIFYLANNPRIQSRLQKEIDELLPKGIHATLEDKPRLPYTDAFIHEVLRHSSLVAIGAFHMASVDTNLGGYRIPKGAIVLGIQSYSHYNPDNFESPEEFRPERFLTPNGKFVTPKDGFIPFGIGKRQCLGEPLARMILFVFLTTMVQSLHFEVPAGKKVDLTPLDNPFMNMPDETQDVLVTIR